jgi:hypothetical protein
MDLKDVLREIKPDRGNFVHGRLPFGGSSTATAIWHLDAGGGSRPQHHKQTSLPQFAAHAVPEKLAKSTAFIPVRKMPSKAPAPPIETTEVPRP